MEIKTNDLKELRSMAEDLLKKADAAENLSAKHEFENDLEQVINKYTAISKANCYAAAKESDDAMKYAVLTFFYPIIRVKEIKDKETDITTRTIVDAERPIDLTDLNKKIVEGIGHDRKWLHAAQKFNFYLTVRAANEVSAGPIKSDAFVMTDIAREINLGKNPCSNTQLLKTLQSIITKMIGDDAKVLSHDVKYLLACYANDNKKSKTSITLANHKTLVGYLKKICYRILTNGKGYEVEQKEYKPA